jgi:hypothetical protein
MDVSGTYVEHKHPGQWRIPVAVAVLLILLCAAGGIWGIWRWMQKTAVSAEAIAVDAPRGQSRRQGPEQPAGKIFKRDDGSIRAFSGNYWLMVTPPNREMTLHCGSGEQWLSKDQQLLFNMAQRWNRGGSMRNMQFTDEQKQQMKLISAEPAVPLSADDKARLAGLIKTWEEAKDAAKAEAQRAVVQSIREIANANIPAAKDAFVANVNKLNSLVTPQQRDQYRQLETARRNGNRPAPNTPGRGA